MSKEEIKHEIRRVLDRLPDKALQDILAFLKTMKGTQTFSFADRAALDKILSEDKDLLEKLAK